MHKLHARSSAASVYYIMCTLYTCQPSTAVLGLTAGYLHLEHTPMLTLLFAALFHRSSLVHAGRSVSRSGHAEGPACCTAASSR